MKIRTRLNLWYTAILCGVAFAVVGAAVYHELVIETRPHHHHGPRGRTDWQGPKSESELDSEDLIDILSWTVTPAMVLGAVGGWWLMRRALAPVADLTLAVKKINDHNLSQPLPRSGNGDELDQLTEGFNAMTARLDEAFQRIREFTLHASHELKTPLTILRGELETALHDESASTAQRERLASQIDEIERLAKIVDGLTLLTKADAGQIALKCEPVRLDELVRESVADIKILGQPQSLEVCLDPCDEITVAGDRHRLRQLLLNLADNAVKYNQPGGRIHISLRRDGPSAALKISNAGPGLAPDLQGRVFERFFRGDASHNSEIEGCGLGLSIAQWIVRAHRGTIEFASRPNELTTVTVQLPLA